CWTFAINQIGSSIHLGGIASSIVIGVVNFIVGAVLGLIAIPFMVGYWKGIRKEYEGETAEITEVFSAFDITIPCLLNYVVAYLIVLAGVACCVFPVILISYLMHMPPLLLVIIGYICAIIPLIILSPIINLTIFFLAKGELQGLNALKRSLETYKKNPILILWTFVLGLFATLGILMCCVGILATTPIAMCASYKLFQQAIGEDNLPPVEPEPVVVQADDDNAPLP
ncbi:MAG: hypothetical protein NT118_06490, partial [Lentisphaerae bacterium]|nr:hypothetical protein [Lentisphaerota bacterium]